MKWTRTKPNVHGARYWFRGYGNKPKVVTIAFHESEGNMAWRVCDSQPTEFGTPLNFFQEKDCEWSDTPIPEPSEN